MNYLYKNIYGVIDDEGKQYNSFKDAINKKLSEYLNSYDQVKKSISNKFKILTYIPIYIDNNNILLPTKSTRAYDCYYINFSKISYIINYDNSITLIFKDNSTISIAISYNKIKNLFTKYKLVKDRLINVYKN